MQTLSKAIRRTLIGLDTVAYRTGYESTLKGGIRFGRANNPYLPGTEEYADWIGGFGRAKREMLTDLDGAPEHDPDMDWDETEEMISHDDLMDDSDLI